MRSISGRAKANIDYLVLNPNLWSLSFGGLGLKVVMVGDKMVQKVIYMDNQLMMVRHNQPILCVNNQTTMSYVN